MLAQLLEHDDTPTEDGITVLHGVSWADYERILEMRGEAPVPRLTYLEGELEFMTPSLPHESIKSRIGMLVEVWCLEKGIEFSAGGSWTIKKKKAKSGLEPAECYIFGKVKGSKRPDLAIEVVWTSGGLSKLDAYAKLGVKEVWFWRRGRISVHVLEGEAYVDSASSRLLAGIDLVQLASYLRPRYRQPSHPRVPRGASLTLRSEPHKRVAGLAASSDITTHDPRSFPAPMSPD